MDVFFISSINAPNEPSTLVSRAQILYTDVVPNKPYRNKSRETSRTSDICDKEINSISVRSPILSSI